MPHRKLIPACCLGVLGLLGLLAGNAAPALALTTELVSTTAAGALADNRSSTPSCSASGRWVAFESEATNLAPGDTNGVYDVFVKDRRTGAVERVSVSSSGEQGNAKSESPVISANGRYVAFISRATNLRAGGLSGSYDFFVHDRQSGETTWVGPGPAALHGISLDLIPAISADGRYVVFVTDHPDAAPGDTNTYYDVFVWDRDTGATERVSLSSGGAQGDADCYHADITDDGRYVVFSSQAGNLVTGDTGGFTDIFLRDRQTGQTTRVSVSTTGEAGNSHSDDPHVTGDGRYLVYRSLATNLAGAKTDANWQIFFHDLTTAETSGISVRLDGTLDGNSAFTPRVTEDGRYVSFDSFSPNLVTGDTNGQTDVFLRDRQTGATSLVSLASGGTQGDGLSGGGDLSADGSTLAYHSEAANLVPGDTNGVIDVFAAYPLVGNKRVMYRAYNEALMYHFFTTRRAEFQNAVGAGYHDESTGVERRLFQVADQALYGNNPLHRLYNPNAGRHYYTFSNAERDSLVALGWSFERDEGYIFTTSDVAPPETIEIYHLYHAVIGTHLYTANAAEVAAVLASIPDWQQHRSLGFAFRGPGGGPADINELPPYSTVLEAAARLSGLR
ncbi:MAG: hypothetical protein KQJ78_18100 [Deltaproteobacteria bacterium]|nr:hypothetical protein [Deltaproteobacteria bacterium]